MKAFLILCLVISVSGLDAHNIHLSQSQKEKANQYSTECIMESGVKPEILADAKKGNIHDDEALKKFILCFFQKSGILTQDAKLNTDVALTKLPQGIDKAAATKLLDECKTKAGKDHADTAYQIFKCYYQDAHPDDFFAVMRKGAASLLQRLRLGDSGILNMIAARCECLIQYHWMEIAIERRQ